MQGVADVSVAAPGVRKRAAEAGAIAGLAKHRKTSTIVSPVPPVQSARLECSEPPAQPRGRRNAEGEHSDDEAHMRKHEPCLNHATSRCKSIRGFSLQKNVQCLPPNPDVRKVSFSENEELLDQEVWYCPLRFGE